MNLPFDYRKPSFFSHTVSFGITSALNGLSLEIADEKVASCPEKPISFMIEPGFSPFRATQRNKKSDTSLRSLPSELAIGSPTHL